MRKYANLILAALLAVGVLASPASAAFDINKLTKKSAGIDQGPAFFVYEDTATAIATLVAANYMANNPQSLEVGDLVYVVGSDAVGFYSVATATTTANTLTAMSGTAASTLGCIASTVTFDPAATTFGSVEEKDVTATGAVLGDTCAVAAPYDLTNQVSAECYVDTADSAVIALRQPGIILRGSGTVNPTNVDDAAVGDEFVTVTGAALGDPAYCTFSLDLEDLILTSSVTNADTVVVNLQNDTGAAVDLGSGTMSCSVEDVSASAVNLASGTWNVLTCTP